MILIVKYIGLVVAGELLLHMLLYGMGKFIGKQNRDRITLSSFLRGLTERAFVVVVLRTDVTSALTLLAALKIATRFKEEEIRYQTISF